ncbi:fibroblast growth factor 23 [Pygocentrus nattereri]|uniref:Fibroblast growth factor 23 n=1 Tax=Pygocentrus nattereri TaxID=42514 RepID=A0AAR2KWD6_PYGNA|nr:fibroblast growth factor 23 [Pygocentrus nattereri]
MRPPAPHLNLRSLFALWLTALQGCGPAAAAPNASPLQSSNWGNPRRFIHLQTSTDLSNFYLEISLNGHVRKTAHRGSYSVILLKAESRDRVAIFGVKSSRFLCMDAEGNLFTSMACNRDDCLFHHKLLENHCDVYYSTKTGILLNLDGVKHRYTASQNLPRSSLFLSEKNTVPLERLKHRERKNRQVDPSDPLKVFGIEEESDSHAVQEEDAEQELEPFEDRNTSREALLSPSDVDPWDIIHARIPGSPRMSGAVG